MFTIALLPTVINKNSFVPRSSSLITASGLSIMSFTFYTLGVLDFTTVSTLSTSIIWWIIFLIRGAKK